MITTLTKRIQIFLVSLLLASLTPGIIIAAQINLPKDADGWTIFTPSADSIIVYVSASGNDGTGKVYAPTDTALGFDPFKPTVPINAYATYAAAYAQTRNGYPDWILVRRGDTFYEAIGTQIRDGRNANEPFLITAYGSSGLSPVFKTGANLALRRVNTGIDWFAISGIDFYAHTRNPDDDNYTGTSGANGFNQYIRAGESSQGILVEGCKFRFYTGNAFNNYGVSANGIVFRRCIILDTYSSGIGHSQGMWMYKCPITLEECIFDHNGWYSQAGSGGIGEATMFNHNTYFAEATNTTFSGNIFMRGSSMNNKFTAGGGTGSSHDITFDNNLYIDGEIGIGIGSNYEDPLRFKDITITNNVITNIGRSQPTNRTLGWGLRIAAWDGGIIANNYIINQPLDAITNTYGMDFCDTIQNVNVTNNIIHNVRFAYGIILDDSKGTNATNMVFSGNKIQISQNSNYTIKAEYSPDGKWTFSDNIYYSDKSADARYRIAGVNRTFSEWQVATGDNSTFEQYSFQDPTRSIETYQASIGETATIDAFITACRAQDRFSWDTRYTAATVNNWIKAGFSSEPNLKPSPPASLKVVNN